MKFREFETSTGKKILAGRDAKSNEELIKQVEDNEIVLHTAKPGSPFVNIKSKKPAKTDIKETAVFCASKSQDWRDNKKDVEIHYFIGKDVFKKKEMKLGTFGVKKFKILKIKKKEIEELIKK
jgi:predicted ribosome quality control (RQC) complex YloA/Tae2 family protein